MANRGVSEDWNDDVMILDDVSDDTDKDDEINTDDN